MNKRAIKGISNTLLKGRITELRCELWFLEHGYLVSTPDLPYQYDFLVDIGNKIIKVQVKTSRYDKGGFSFNTISTTHNSDGYTKRIYSENEVDYFMTYWEGKCYLIHYSNVKEGCKKLRTSPTKNGQIKGIYFAEDFLAEKIIKNEKENI